MLQEEGYTYILENTHEYCVEESHPINEELYYLEEDPTQQNNIIQENSKIVDDMRTKLCEIYNKGDNFSENPNRNLNESMVEHLKDLGYLD